MFVMVAQVVHNKLPPFQELLEAEPCPGINWHGLLVFNPWGTWFNFCLVGSLLHNGFQFLPQLLSKRGEKS